MGGWGVSQQGRAGPRRPGGCLRACLGPLTPWASPSLQPDPGGRGCGRLGRQPHPAGSPTHSAGLCWGTPERESLQGGVGGTCLDGVGQLGEGERPGPDLGLQRSRSPASEPEAGPGPGVWGAPARAGGCRLSPRSTGEVSSSQGGGVPLAPKLAPCPPSCTGSAGDPKAVGGKAS